MRLKGIFIFFIYMFFSAVVLNAEETINLSLKDCIELGIKNNFEVKKYDYDVLSKQEDTIQIKSQYEPQINFQIGKTDIQTSGANAIFGTHAKKDTFNMGVSKKFNYTGGRLNLNWENEKDDSDLIFKSFNPSYDSNITLSYIQPIAKNFAGKNDKNYIHMAEYGESISTLLPALQKNILVNKIENVYLDLTFAENNLAVQNKFLKRALKRLSENRKKLKDGLIENVDVISSEASVVLRKASILIAEDAVKNTIDILKNIIALPNDKKYLFEVKYPDFVEQRALAEDSVIREALVKRPDLKIIEKTIEISSLENRINKNEKLPSLDVITSYGLGNTGEQWGDNYDSVTSAENPTWYIGLNLEFFPFNKNNISRYKKSDYVHKKNIYDLEGKKPDIVTECKSVVRRVNTQALYLKASQQALELQKKKLELEEIKFNQGRSSLQWILDFEDDLNRAEIEFYQALTNYYKSQADLKLITGAYK